MDKWISFREVTSPQLLSQSPLLQPHGDGTNEDYLLEIKTESDDSEDYSKRIEERFETDHNIDLKSIEFALQSSKDTNN